MRFDVRLRANQSMTEFSITMNKKKQTIQLHLAAYNEIDMQSIAQLHFFYSEL